ncbi:hypothetical protein [Novipirellula galeiformis]|nr:hypothetical protein [Novipirellula galeiformis]
MFRLFLAVPILLCGLSFAEAQGPLKKLRERLGNRSNAANSECVGGVCGASQSVSVTSTVTMTPAQSQVNCTPQASCPPQPVMESPPCVDCDCQSVVSEAPLCEPVVTGQCSPALVYVVAAQQPERAKPLRSMVSTVAQLPGQAVAQMRANYMAKHDMRNHPPQSAGSWSSVGKFEGVGWHSSVTVSHEVVPTCTPSRGMTLVGDAVARGPNGTYRCRIWR